MENKTTPTPTPTPTPVETTKLETQEQIKPLFEDMFPHNEVASDEAGLKKALDHQEKMKQEAQK